MRQPSSDDRPLVETRGLALLFICNISGGRVGARASRPAAQLLTAAGRACAAPGRTVSRLSVVDITLCSNMVPPGFLRGMPLVKVADLQPVSPVPIRTDRQSPSGCAASWLPAFPHLGLSVSNVTHRASVQTSHNCARIQPLVVARPPKGSRAVGWPAGFAVGLDHFVRRPRVS